MNTEKRFFAAANGYTGFRSYFDTLFNSEDFNKIYVLKGGPGTGKSSLMKKLSSELVKKAVECEYIHCSSDPDSLDGVIFEKNGVRAAILDGTSPHERDANIPGAIDEIINLAQNLDSLWLSARRKEILELNKEKKNAYKTAYSYLNIAGAANAKANEILKESYDENLSNLIIKSLAEQKYSLKATRIKTRLISGFGRHGEVVFDTLDKGDFKRFSIVGDKEAAFLFLNKLFEQEAKNHTEVIRFPYSLDDRKTEAIYFPDNGIIYTVHSGGEEISTSDFISQKQLDAEQTKTMHNIEKEALLEAERWFAIASDFHFRLEEIYSHCIDFSKNDTIFEEKAEELLNLFGI